MIRIADVVQMLAHTPYLSAALVFTFAVLALDAWAAGRDTHAPGADAGEPRS